MYVGGEYCITTTVGVRRVPVVAAGMPQHRMVPSADADSSDEESPDQHSSYTRLMWPSSVTHTSPLSVWYTRMVCLQAKCTHPVSEAPTHNNP